MQVSPCSEHNPYSHNANFYALSVGKDSTNYISQVRNRRKKEERILKILDQKPRKCLLRYWLLFGFHNCATQ